MDAQKRSCLFLIFLVVFSFSPARASARSRNTKAEEHRANTAGKTRTYGETSSEIQSIKQTHLTKCRIV
jgi:hypothetical protein